MRDTADFDAFYADARQRLLHQTYALTGDLAAAQSSVRDAFVIAWHHWRKVSQLEDPERWVRPVAWSHAVRRRGTRIWHRTRTTDPELGATLDALGRLSLSQRKVLLLTQLTRGSMDEIAREAELPLTVAERELQSATALFATHRNIDSALIRTALDPLAGPVAEARWPRVTIIRRTGSARRRSHTLVGAAVVVGLLVASGAAVTHEDGVRPRLTKEKVVASPSPVSTTPTAAPVTLSSSQLLGADQLERVAPDRRWTVESTSGDLEDDGMSLPCQSSRYADPDAIGSLVRTYQTTPGPGRTTPAERRRSVSAFQSTELSATPRAARRAYSTTTGWYAGCPEERVQLLDTYAVDGVGDDATLLVLRSWRAPVTTVVVGVARSGQVTTTTMTRVTGSDRPDLARHASLLAAAVNSLCGAPGAGTCAGPPEPVAIAPLPTGPAPGMIGTIDLPPVTGVADAWVATHPRKATVNAAATQCDEGDFTRAPITHALTRTFVLPEARLPTTFGLTETVGTLPAPEARAFVAGIRTRVAGCEDRHLGTEVVRVADETTASHALTVWRLAVEVSDTQTVTYLMGIVRSGTAVAQVGFTPTDRVQMPPGAFVALVERARDRLAHMPAPLPDDGKPAKGDQG